MKINLFLVSILISFLMFLNGCGYKPVSYFTKETTGEKIFIEVDIDLKDPQNSILIKEELIRATINKLNSTLAKKEESNSSIFVKMDKINFEPIQYDKYGYVISYQAIVNLKFTFIDINKKIRHITTSGNYDFSIEANSVISDQKRYEAIKEASYKAVENFIAKITFMGGSQ